MYVFFFKQKTAYEMRISDWSSDVCSSDLKNSSTSQGALRKNWVTNQDPARSGGSSEICMSPSTAPAAVPIAMARKEIAILKTKPSSSSGEIGRASCRERVCKYV